MSSQASEAHQHAEGSYIAQAGPHGTAIINVFPGLTDDMLQALVSAFTSMDASGKLPRELADTANLLKSQLEVTQAAIEGFFRILAIEAVPSEELASKLEEVARRYHHMQSQLRSLVPESKAAEALIEEALRSLAAASSLKDYDRIDEMLRQIEALHVSQREAATERFNRVYADIHRHTMAVIETRVSRAELCMTRLRYREAAALLAETQPLVPLGMLELRSFIMFREADAQYAEGEYKKESSSLRNSIALFRSALGFIDRSAKPLEWATGKHSLGTALLSMGQRDGSTEYIVEAVAALEDAISEPALQGASLLWANAKNSLGLAQSIWGKREPTSERLLASVATHSEALAKRSRETAPEDWAQSQHNIGSTLLEIGVRAMTPVALGKAISSFRSALTERTVERNPGRWAGTQNNLGYALAEVGRRSGDEEHLIEAVEAFEKAASVLKDNRENLRWAQVQNNLGATLVSLAQRSDDQVIMHRAVAAFKDALCFRIRDESPLLWAETQSNLGYALGQIAVSEKNLTRFAEAERALTFALEERTRAAMPVDWAATTQNLGAVIFWSGIYQSDVSVILRAIRTFSRSLAIRRRDNLPVAWAETMCDIAGAFFQVGKITDDWSNHLQALSICQGVMGSLPGEFAPIARARLLHLYGEVLWSFGCREPTISLLLKAKNAVEDARKIYRQAKISRFDENIENLLVDVQKRVTARARKAIGSDAAAK